MTKDRHDELVEALVGSFSQVRVGNQFDPDSQMGPLAVRRQRDRVLGYIEKGVAEGATLATGGGRPAHLDKGWFVEPTVFSNVENSQTIAREEIFGPVVSVIPAEDEQDAVAIANDTIYGLNASVFTNDVDRAREVAGQLRTRNRRTQFVPHRLRHRLRGLQAVGDRARGRDRGFAPVPGDQDRHPGRAPVGVWTS